MWGLATGREDLGSDANAFGFKVDYPNDLWDIQLTAKRIGRDFDPSIGSCRAAPSTCIAGKSTTGLGSRAGRFSSSARVHAVAGDGLPVSGRAIVASWRR